MDFRKAFQYYGGRQKDAFLSRLFGIFSESIVSIWGEHENSPYWNMGRPYVKTSDEKRGNVFDFTFKEKSTGKLFVCEQKCELEFQNYKFLELTDPDQLKHHKGPESKNPRGFTRFLDIANNSQNYTIKVDGEPVKIEGIILIWGKVSEEGKIRVKEEFKIHDVLSLEEIINQLIKWESKKYRKLIEDKQNWSNELFENLTHI